MSRLHLLSGLFQKHRSELLRQLSNKFRKNLADAEDIVQDAFHNVLKAENIEEIDNPRAYLFQTANNLALNRIRKQKRHKQYIEEQNETELNELGPERSASAQKDLQRLESALRHFPEKYRRTFILSRMHSKTYKEISLELGIAESTVEKHIIKTLKYLRDQLELES